MAERSRPTRARLAGWEWALAAAILLGGFALRVIAFHDAPPGVIHDEVRNWLNAQLILGGDIRPLYPYGGGREALYLFIQAAMFRLVGDNLLAARLPSIAFSLIGMAGGFALARRLFGRAAGLVTLAGMAASFWSVLFARLAVRTGSMPALALVAAYLYARLLMDSLISPPPLPNLMNLNLSIRPLGASVSLPPEGEGWADRRSGRDEGQNEPRSHWPGFLIAGTALGATLYTYPSALIFPAILLAWIGGLALARPAWLRGRWPPLLASFVLAFGLAIPLLRAWADPATAARADEVNAPLEALLSGDPGPTLANVEPVLKMFTIQGDPGLEFNVENQPVFPTAPLAALFYLGLIGALIGVARPRKERWPSCLLALLWLGAMLVPTLVTEDPVNPSRTIGLLGIVYTFPAISIELLTGADRGWRGAGWLAAIVAVLSLSIELGYTANGYFVTWARNPVVEFLYQENYQAIARDLDAQTDPTAVAVGGLTPDEMDPASMRLLMADDDRAAALGFFDPQTALLIPASTGGAPRQVIVALESTLRPASVEEPFDAYTRYTLVDDPLAPTSDRIATFADPQGAPLADLIRIWASDNPDEGHFTLITRWEAHRPSAERLRIFVHLTNPGGEIAAQSDVLGVPATQWRPGDTILQAHDLALPAGDADSYRLTIGLYQPETGARMAVSTPPGGDAAMLDLPTH
jgi:4-amino-4-deoxy-L-arabinose transferase-like glycosyltransferase